MGVGGSTVPAVAGAGAGPEAPQPIQCTRLGLFIKGLHTAHCLAGTWKRTREGHPERGPGYSTAAYDVGEKAFEFLKSYLPKSRAFQKNAIVINPLP